MWASFVLIHLVHTLLTYLTYFSSLESVFVRQLQLVTYSSLLHPAHQKAQMFPLFQALIHGLSGRHWVPN